MDEAAHGPWKDWIMGQLNLQGLEKWPKEEQDQARKLLVKWEHLFACSNLDLRKTSLIKHQIKLTDWMPFKEHYRSPPGHCSSSVSHAGGHPQSPIEVYNCNLHVLDLVWDGLQVACMTKDSWHQAQLADPVLGHVFARMQMGPCASTHKN